VVAKPPNTSHPPTVNGVDRLYFQLAGIHAIIIVQLIECTRWHRADPIASLAQAKIGW
jgi:hypothetical protein